MTGKILIKCDLVVRTGLHIGGSSSFSAIGTVDSPVIRDPFTGLPIVPGSSLKGKLRTLLARRSCVNGETLPDFSADGTNCICTELRCSRLFGCDSFEFGAAKEHGCNDSIKIRIVKRKNNRKLEKTSRREVLSCWFFHRIEFS